MTNEPKTDHSTLKSKSPLSRKALFGWAFAHSVLFVLAFPPFSLWFMAFLAPAALAVASIGAARMRDLALAVAITQGAAWALLHAWVYDVTVAGYPAMVAYLTVFSVVEACVLRWLTCSTSARPWRLSIIVALPLVLLASDDLRGMVLFHGYPWYLRAQPLIDEPLFARLAPIAGIWLPGVLCLVVAGSLARVVLVPIEARRDTLSVLGAVCFAVLVLAFALRAILPTSAEPERSLQVLVLQTNLATSNKVNWSPEAQVKDVNDFFAMTAEGLAAARNADVEPDLIVWPETMLPSIGFEQGDYFTQLAKNAVEHFNVPMLVGSPSYHGVRQDDNGEWQWDAHFNSAYLVEPGQPVTQRVDKFFLTPFGETMPYIAAWPWLQDQLLSFGASGMQFDLDAADDISLIELKGQGETEPWRIAVPICFEDTVSPVVRRMVFANGQRQADLIVNLSNDGWFGTGALGMSDAGRAMHVLCARWRAAETRTWMVRSVNTGNSVVIDAGGVVVARLGSGPQTAGVLVAEAYSAPPGVPSFALLGNWFGRIMAIGVLGCLVFKWWR